MASQSDGCPSVFYRQLRIARFICLLAIAQLAGSAHGADRIRKDEYLPVGGAGLYLLVRSDDASAPLLLWLHGGPGGAERPLFRYYNGALESRFIVAYWDQRGAGRSYDPDADPSDLTVDRHLRDLDAVVDHLLATFGKRKLILAGHSWGGALGLLYAHAHPDKVNALLAIAPLVDTMASRREEYDYVSAEAHKHGDARVMETVESVGPPPYGSVDAALAIEHIADSYGFVYHTKPRKLSTMFLGILRGLVTPWEIPRLIRANNVSLAAMQQEIAALDLTTSVRSLDVPVYFLLGRYDHHVGSDIAASYFEALNAPCKAIIWFDESAHNPPFEEPDKFNATVVAFAGGAAKPRCSVQDGAAALGR